MAHLYLNTLPLDGVRPILSYLDVESLVKLFATFDRKIQALLASPNAFEYLYIEATREGLVRAPYRYFLSAVRNVNSLKVENELGWSAKTISLLQTLNPLHLDLGNGFLVDDYSKALRKLDTQVQELFSGPYNNYPVPNFRILTPRLETLLLSDDTFTPHYDREWDDFQETLTNLELPPTLSKLHLGCSVSPEILFDLETPAHITSLSVGGREEYTYSLPKIFARFTSLQHLAVSGCTVDKDERTWRFPPALETLTYRVNHVDWPSLLSHTAFRETSISSVSLSIAERSFVPRARSLFGGLDFAQWFPPTAKTLRIEFSFEYLEDDEIYFEDLKNDHGDENEVFLRSLPPSLTSLTIEAFLLPSTDTAPTEKLGIAKVSTVRLQNLLHLEHLEILSSAEADGNFALASYGNLPPGLKTLIIKPLDFKSLTLAEIERLPKTLTTLHVHSFDLKLVDAFRSHLKDCRLFIESRLFNPWHVPDSDLASSGFWFPQYDLVKLQLFVQTYYNRSKVHFVRAFVLTEPLPNAARRLEEFLGLPPTDDDRVLTLSSTLQSVALPCSALFPSVLPRSLTALTAPNALGNLRVWPFPNLTHLDAPKIGIPLSHHEYLANLTTLRATIVDIEDVNVAPFLTTVLSLKARTNAKISIETHCTGALLPGDDRDGLQNVSWPLIQQKSASILNALLASPMPPSSGLLPQHDSFIIENDTIGRIVTSLKVVTPDSRTYICIPASATTAHIEGLHTVDWSLAPNWLRLPSSRQDGLRLASMADFARELPNRLVRLEMLRVHPFECHIVFPETLKHLAISLARNAQFGSNDFFTFPSQLVDLALWHTFQPAQLPYSKLPTSLKHLCLTDMNLFDSNKSLDLPHLKTLLLGRLRSLKVFPIEQLYACLVGQLAITDEERKDANPDVIAKVKVDAEIDYPVRAFANVRAFAKFNILLMEYAASSSSSSASSTEGLSTDRRTRVKAVRRPR